jgi:hypothetical protein
VTPSNYRTGRAVQVIEVYDDEAGQEGGALATVVVDDE